MSQMPMDDYLEHVESDPLRDFAVVDPPYGGGEVGGYDYLDMMGGNAHKELATQLGGLAEDGLPIVAFNAATEADHYRDQGFRTILNRRPDNTSTKKDTRGVKPEMVAVANVPAGNTRISNSAHNPEMLSCGITTHGLMRILIPTYGKDIFSLITKIHSL